MSEELRLSRVAFTQPEIRERLPNIPVLEQVTKALDLIITGVLSQKLEVWRMQGIQTDDPEVTADFTNDTKPDICIIVTEDLIPSYDIAKSTKVLIRKIRVPLVVLLSCNELSTEDIEFLKDLYFDKSLPLRHGQLDLFLRWSDFLCIEDVQSFQGDGKKKTIATKVMRLVKSVDSRKQALIERGLRRA